MAGRFQFLKSATRLQDCPEDLQPEIVVLGRSNAGKSTLINAWTGSRLAKTSAKPGKTRLINFFSGPQYRLVDFPGYGFSSRGGDEQASWAGMIEPFLGARANICGAVIVMDCRRDWTDDEKMLMRFLQRREAPIALALSKVDKINRAEEARIRKKFAQIQGVEKIFFVSGTNKTGLVELEEYVFVSWVKSRGTS